MVMYVRVRDVRMSMCSYMHAYVRLHTPEVEIDRDITPRSVELVFWLQVIKIGALLHLFRCIHW